MRSNAQGRRNPDFAEGFLNAEINLALVLGTLHASQGTNRRAAAVEGAAAAAVGNHARAVIAELRAQMTALADALAAEVAAHRCTSTALEDATIRAARAEGALLRLQRSGRQVA